MTPFRDRPIGQKALVLGVAPALSAILLVAAGSIVATYVRARATALHDLETESAIVAENVAAALEFDDKAAATDTVRAFRSKSSVSAVCVYGLDGALFTSFTQPGQTCASRMDGATAHDATLVDETDSVIAGRKVGTVRVVGNLDSLAEWMRIQLLVIVGTLGLALVVALAFTRRLQRSIVIPVEHLAETADRVATARDYRLRATRLTDDEVGRLVDSFNGMMDRIEQQREATASLLQREQEASVLKDQFLAAVSHELRTPLNAILGWAHIVRHLAPDADTMTRALESIERNAKAQARVVDDLLQVSRLAAGKVHVQFQLVDLRTVVESAVDVVRPELSAKQLQLTVDLPSSPCFVAGDPGRLEQVLWNLLTNAVRFTPSGGVHVDVMTSDASVTVRVADTGIGIAPDFLPLVFDRFRQADGSLTRKYGGLGLGLAIAKELADLHGGSIQASSPGPGRGATFTVELPRLAGQPGAVSATGTASRGALPLGGIRVLAVDDDADALAILRTALRAEGALVSTASNGIEAVQAWRARRYDVLICDLAMPDMDGFAVLRAARDATQGPNGKRAFAIALTAHTSADIQRAIGDAHFDAHVSKPYEIRTLVSLIRNRDAAAMAAPNRAP